MVESEEGAAAEGVTTVGHSGTGTSRRTGGAFAVERQSDLLAGQAGDFVHVLVAAAGEADDDDLFAG